MRSQVKIWDNPFSSNIEIYVSLCKRQKIKVGLLRFLTYDSWYHILEFNSLILILYFSLVLAQYLIAKLVLGHPHLGVNVPCTQSYNCNHIKQVHAIFGSLIYNRCVSHKGIHHRHFNRVSQPGGMTRACSCGNTLLEERVKDL